VIFFRYPGMQDNFFSVVTTDCTPLIHGQTGNQNEFHQYLNYSAMPAFSLYVIQFVLVQVVRTLVIPQRIKKIIVLEF
jgi:hypothetical protein